LRRWLTTCVVRQTKFVALGQLVMRSVLCALRRSSLIDLPTQELSSAGSTLSIILASTQLGKEPQELIAAALELLAKRFDRVDPQASRSPCCSFERRRNCRDQSGHMPFVATTMPCRPGSTKPHSSTRAVGHDKPCHAQWWGGHFLSADPSCVMSALPPKADIAAKPRLSPQSREYSSQGHRALYQARLDHRQIAHLRRR
jgi:hypothetical protein